MSFDEHARPSAGNSGQNACNDARDGALSVASRGWRVFPLRERDKRPRFKGWQDKATCDQEAIRAWFDECPGMNYGILTGEGLVVLDVDGRKGRESLFSLSPAAFRTYTRDNYGILVRQPFISYIDRFGGQE